MIRALLAMSMLTHAAVDATAPEDAAIAFQKGDVLCVGYDAETQTCLIKITISRSAPDGTVALEEMQLTDFGAPLRLSTLTTTLREKGRYCLVPKTIRAVAQPELHPSAPLLTITTVEGLNRYARADHCVEHRRCGDRHAALAYSHGDRFAEDDMVYSLFRADDPATTKLTPRPTSFKALDPVKGFVPIGCLPTP